MPAIVNLLISLLAYDIIDLFLVKNDLYPLTWHALYGVLAIAVWGNILIRESNCSLTIIISDGDLALP
jgi:hypothetical protein